MTDTTVTYEREMVMTYGTDSLSKNKRSRMNTLLYQEGLCMVDDYAYRQDTTPERFGNKKNVIETKQIEISVDGNVRLKLDSGSARLTGWRDALLAVGFYNSNDSTEGFTIMEIDNADTRVMFDKKLTTKTQTIEQTPQGYYLIYAGEFIGDQEIDFEDWRPDGHTLAVCGDMDEYRHTFMRVELRIGAYSAPTLSFKMWYDADSIEKKDAIEQRLVTDPLPLMGQIQATVERCLAFVGVDITEPVIDCEFKCLNESKSECAPDIIEMVRAEKQKHL